jgi:hypothetical protein
MDQLEEMPTTALIGSVFVFAFAPAAAAGESEH